jgi:DNA-binding beta-propeller fold protein YncE
MKNEIAVDELRNQIYMADPTGNQIVVIDGGATNRTTYLPGTSTYLRRIAVNPLRNEV